MSVAPPRRKAVAVFCGSKEGASPDYAVDARRLGAALASRGCSLVYGGAAHGLMGAVADAVLDGGGKVVGVIPKGLASVEFAHPGLTEAITVDTLHQRKAVMADRCDAFVALPGGFGTMDEFFEALSWLQLGLHRKPIGLLDTLGFYTLLTAWLDRAIDEGFAPREHRPALFVDAHPETLVQKVLSAELPELPVRWSGPIPPPPITR